VIVNALRGVDLDVAPGEMTLLVGPSGCGKTTLLSVIAGILEPTSGMVSFMGRDMSSMTRGQKTELRQTSLGFVFQQYNLLPALNATENAAVPLIVAGWRRVHAFARAKEVLVRLGLGDRASAFPSELSGGQQQRVAIARALVHEPPLIVCDEPTSALDAASGHSIMELLREIAVQSDRAVIVVTHDPRVFPFGDRIAEMEDGRIINMKNGEHETTAGSADTGQNPAR